MNSPACEAVRASVAERAIELPVSYNYIGAFLTFRCPYRCSYCINRFHGSNRNGCLELNGREWIRFFERIEARDVPVTLQGGEPGLHPDFLDIVERTSCTHGVDILTNLAFDLKAFVRRIDPERLNREAPYAPIRVSYHPEQFSLREIVERVQFIRSAGFRVGLYGVLHPVQLTAIEHARRVCEDLGIDFRTKPFLGWYDGKLYGRYALADACAGGAPRRCECAPSELLIAPDGAIHRCHHYLYEQLEPLQHVTEPTVTLSDDYLPCGRFGHCNPCDVKVKNNRFQQFGHVSMRIRNLLD